MQPTTTTVRLLYVTGKSVDTESVAQRLGLDDESVELRLARSLEDAVDELDGATIDCVLCTSDDETECLRTVRTLRGEYPWVPSIVFAGGEDQSFVDDVLEAGASEVLQSTPEGTSGLLLRRRIDGVVDELVQATRDRTHERYETILNTAVDPIYQLDTEGTVVAVNDATVELTGYERSELIGAHVSLVMDEADIERGRRFIEGSLASDGQQVHTLETELQRKDGDRVPCEIRIAVLESNGEFEGTVGVVRDVSDRKERARKLRERDELLGQISESVNDVVWVSTPEGDDIEFVSDAYEDIWGRPCEELLADSRSFVEGIHPEDRERVVEALERQQEDPWSYDETYRVVKPGGETRWVRDRAFGVYDDDELVRIVGVAQDVTERRVAQQQLQNERDMFAQGPVVVFKWRAAAGLPVEYVTENVTDMMGYTPDQLESGDIEYETLIHEDDLGRVTREVRQSEDDSRERFSHDPYRVVTSDGDIRWVKDTTKVIREDGEVTHYLGYLVDVTERKEREQELQKLKEEYEMMVETLGDVVYTLDEDYYFMSVNGAAEDVTGFTCEELEGAHLSRLLSEEDIERALEYRQKVIEGEIGTGSIEVDANRKDGSITPVEFRYRRLPYQDEFRGTAGVIRDVSERKRREQELQAERDLVENIFDASPVGILVVDDDGRMTRVNERAAEIVSVDSQDLRGSGIGDWDWQVFDEQGERVPESEYPTKRVFEEATPIYGWEAKLDRDGEPVWISVSGAPMVEDAGEIPEAVITIEDITERKRAQFDLRAEKEFTEQLIEALDDVLYLFDEDGEFRRWNQTLEQVTGYDADELASKEPTALFEGEDVARVEDATEEVLETGSSTVEANVVTKHGETIPYEFRGARLTGLNGDRLVCGIGRDISERKERERQIERQRDELAQLDRLNAVIRSVDQALVGASSREEIERMVCELLAEYGHYEFALKLEHEPDGRLVAGEWTDGAAEYVSKSFPIEDPSAENSPAVRAMQAGSTQVVRDIDAHPKIGPDDAEIDMPDAVAAVPVTYKGQRYGVIAVFAGDDERFGEREIGVLDELGDTVGYAIAAVEQREREATLTSLYQATRALLGTESKAEVSEVVVDVAGDVLDLPAVGIFLFDNERNALAPVAATDQLLSFYGETTEFGPGLAESAAWHSYVNGDAQYFEDIRDSEHVANPDTDARSTLIFPLGEHGVFVAASEQVDVFDEHRRQLVGLLAATTETALDRLAGQESIREHEEELREQTSKLEQFEQLNTLLREVTASVRTASSRTDVEQALCDALVDHSGFAFAWTGSVPPDGTTVEPQTWAGDAADYLDDVSVEVTADEPAARTATSSEATVVDDVTDHLREWSWARAAVDRNFQSALAVPLVHGGTTYGVVTVYATEPGAFDETTRAVLADLGELAAFGINVVETRQGILAEQVTELELAITAPDTFLNTVATFAGEPVQYREITPSDGDSARVLFELDDPPVEDVLELESEFVAVDSLTHAERGDQHLFRATVGADTVAATLLSRGAIPVEVVASDDQTKAVVRLPQQLGVREFLDRVRESYPETELVSRQTVDREASSGETVRVALEEELTDRQREVLVTAYESGFFESPRETTGAELADLLGVSQPTVTHHLREAQRRLFAELFEETL